MEMFTLPKCLAEQLLTDIGFGQADTAGRLEDTILEVQPKHRAEATPRMTSVH